MNSVIRECALLLMAVTIWTEPALARSYLNCLTKKVVIVDTPRGSTSSSIEEHLGLWIDEAAKTLVLADGTPLTVHRFEDHWISAARGDMSYELERQNGNLTYASSTTKGGNATITIGSGRCEIALSCTGHRTGNCLRKLTASSGASPRLTRIFGRTASAGASSSCTATCTRAHGSPCLLRRGFMDKLSV